MILRSFLVIALCLAAAILESVFPYVFHMSAARADILLLVVLYLALNDEVVPAVRSRSSQALRIAAKKLAKLAEHLEQGRD